MSVSEEVLTELIVEASSKLVREMRNANRFGELKEYLSKIGMLNLYPLGSSQYYNTDPHGKILIVGSSSLKEKEIHGVIRSLGLDKSRIELELGYNENKTYSYDKLKYNTEYRLILVGPLPHQTTGTDGYSSIITRLEAEDYFPKVIRLTNSNSLKITKTSIREALTREIESGYLKL